MREEFPLTTTDSPNPKNLGGRGAPLRFSRPRRDVWDGQVQRRTQKAELRVSADAQADMPSAGASGAICVQRFDDSLTSCNSHYVSHFAAFFIVARAKISVVESFGYLFFFSEESGDMSQRKMALALCLVCVCVCLRVTRESANKSTGSAAQTKRSEFAERIDHSNDPSAGSPTETLLRLLLPLGGRVYRSSRRKSAETANSRQSQRFTSTPNR